jgi:hypothetical protein
LIVLASQKMSTPSHVESRREGHHRHRVSLGFAIVKQRCVFPAQPGYEKRAPLAGRPQGRRIAAAWEEPKTYAE